jgi:hypothetical protein
VWGWSCVPYCYSSVTQLKTRTLIRPITGLLCNWVHWESRGFVPNCFVYMYVGHGPRKWKAKETTHALHISHGFVFLPAPTGLSKGKVMNEPATGWAARRKRPSRITGSKKLHDIWLDSGHRPCGLSWLADSPPCPCVQFHLCTVGKDGLGSLFHVKNPLIILTQWFSNLSVGRATRWAC